MVRIWSGGSRRTTGWRCSTSCTSGRCSRRASEPGAAPSIPGEDGEGAAEIGARADVLGRGAVGAVGLRGAGGDEEVADGGGAERTAAGAGDRLEQHGGAGHDRRGRRGAAEGGGVAAAGVARLEVAVGE